VPIRLLVVDDSALVRVALGEYLQAQPDLCVVGMARDGQEAVDLAVLAHPDVVIMDLLMPGLDGVAATRALLSRAPGTRVLILSGVGLGSSVREAFAAGACGYLLKDGNATALLDGVRRCHAGGRPLSPELMSLLDT
jgi:DNA-binding NarL/FixJ family response regulator